MNLKKISSFFQRNINYLIVITFLIFVFSATFGSSFMETLRLLKLKSDLQQQIAQGEELNSQLDEEIAQIGTQSYIETIARKYLELYYPNEQIIIPVENSLKNTDSNNNQEKNQTNTNSEENESETTETVEEETPTEVVDEPVNEEPTEEVVDETTQEAETEEVSE